MIGTEVWVITDLVDGHGAPAGVYIRLSRETAIATMKQIVADQGLPEDEENDELWRDDMTNAIDALPEMGGTVHLSIENTLSLALVGVRE